MVLGPAMKLCALCTFHQISDELNISTSNLCAIMYSLYVCNFHNSISSITMTRDTEFLFLCGTPTMGPKSDSNSDSSTYCVT